VLQKEIKTALDVAEEKLERDIFLIPVWIQAGTPLPREDMPDRLAKLQWINLSEQNGWQKLTRSIEHQLRRLGRDVPVPMPSAVAPSVVPTAVALDAEALVARVRASVDVADIAGIEAGAAIVVEALARRNHGFTRHHAARVANLLWRKHLLKIVRPVSDAFLRGGLDVPSVRRVYADALLAEGWLTAALDAILKGEHSGSADPTERALAAEVRGRIETSMYLQDASSAPAAAPDHLWRAVATYNDIYASDRRRHLVHGARAAALVLRADRAGISNSSSVAPADIAVQVLNEVRESEESGRSVNLEECEAAIHAALVAPRHDEAAAWMQRYVTHAQADVANLRMLRDQLSQVWQLEPHTAPGSALMPMVAERLKALSSPWVQVSAPAALRESPAAEPIFERVLGDDKFQTLTWYKRGLQCAQHVVRIETAQGAPLATGFLLWGRDLHASFPDELILMTNAYVVTDDAAVKANYAFSVPGPQDVRARFGRDSVVHEVQVVWSSFTAATTILRLPSPIDRDGRLQLAARFPRPGAQAYVLGHPGGRDLEFSLIDNLILDFDERVVHYRTPTEAGSSGSPVFDRTWEVIAIHHGGGNAMPRLHGATGTYEANEGIRLDFIRKEIAAGNAVRM
jgi:hypothetical protein